MPYAERLQVVWLRAPSGYTEDVAVITMHFSTPSDGPLGNTVRASVETAFNTFMSTTNASQGNYATLSQYRWYDQQVWPVLSPLLRVQAASAFLGAVAAPAIPQQSCSVTLETAHRVRWGRWYVPAYCPTLTAQGRYTTTKVDQLATAAATFVQSAKTAGALPVVWSPKGGKGPPAFAPGTYEPVTGVRVDDIPEVIRSRRWQGSPYRKLVAIT